jgi:hypothetical protein
MPTATPSELVSVLICITALLTAVLVCLSVIEKFRKLTSKEKSHACPDNFLCPGLLELMNKRERDLSSLHEKINTVNEIVQRILGKIEHE